MGDRALIQFTDGKEVSPVAYLHWGGSRVSKYLDETKQLMQTRPNDVAYTFARFLGICHADSDGNLSLGAWNQPTKLTAKDSHGDAGAFVVNVCDWSVEAMGGYGLTELDKD